VTASPKSKRPSGTRPKRGSALSAWRKSAADEAPLAPDATLLRVALAFVAIYAVLQAGLWALTYYQLLNPVIQATTDITAWCANATGVPATVSGNEIGLATRILRIDLDCTGLSLVAIYSALVLAYPLSFKSRIVGLAAGIPALLLANFLRLWAVAQLSGPLDQNTFMFVHDYLFKIAMVAVVIALWGLYLSWARRHAA
jgi:exosortase/archaeosortase family protein